MTTETLTPTQAHRKAVEERLLGLAKKGRLTPDVVIEDARGKHSPLHSEFDWDVNRAAYATWVETARTLIRSVRYEVTTEVHEAKAVMVSTGLPAFVRDPGVAHEKQGYISVMRVKQTEQEKAGPILVEEFECAKRRLERGLGYAAAFGAEVQDEVSAMIGHLDTLIEKVRNFVA